jgi:hypothetical protein
MNTGNYKLRIVAEGETVRGTYVYRDGELVLKQHAAPLNLGFLSRSDRVAAPMLNLDTMEMRSMEANAPRGRGGLLRHEFIEADAPLIGERVAFDRDELRRLSRGTPEGCRGRSWNGRGNRSAGRVGHGTNRRSSRVERPIQRGPLSCAGVSSEGRVGYASHPRASPDGSGRGIIHGVVGRHARRVGHGAGRDRRWLRR